MKPQDHLSILLYSIGQVASFRNESRVLGKELMPLESTEKIIKNFCIVLSKINQVNLRYSDIASAFMLLSRFQFTVKRYEDAALSLIKCLENALYQGTRMVSYENMGSPISSIYEDLGAAFQNSNMLDIAEDAYQRSYALMKQFGFVGSYEPLLKLGRLYQQIGATEKAISTYNKFLSETLTLLEDERYKHSEGFWSIRELAAYFIMENTLPKLDINCFCLCGSGHKYVDCCSKLMA